MQPVEYCQYRYFDKIYWSFTEISEHFECLLTRKKGIFIMHEEQHFKIYFVLVAV